MKKYYFLLVTLFSVNGAIAQWEVQNSGTTNHLNSVYFTDLNNGWAVGDSGTILHTADRGLNWVTQSSNTTFKLNAVFFTDTDHGYVAGNGIYPVSGNIILKTTDGGLTWADTSYGSQTQEWDLYDLRSVHFTDSSTGYIYGFYNGDWELFILKTTDSGANWNKVWSMGVSVEQWTVGSMYFSGPDTGYVVYTDGGMASPDAYVYKTTDGWTTSTGNIVVSKTGWTWGGLHSVFFPDADTGYVIGWDYDDLWKTVDGGATWTNLVGGGGNSLFFINGSDGCIVGGGGTIRSSTDGGASWETQNSNTTSGLYSVYFIDENTGYAVGESGIIVKTTNGIVGLSEHHQTENALAVYPNPASTNINIETTFKGDLSILNLNGQQLLEQKITVPLTTIDVSKLLNGIYLLMAVDENGVQVGKIIKQ
jgi:photosystem II stability/assembly factor-like uncharacterized protein